jgi:hypothetical protein
MVKGERVCGVLLEYQKVDSRPILATHYGPELLQVMEQATDQVSSHGGYLMRSALKRASNTGTRLALVGLG